MYVSVLKVENNSVDDIQKAFYLQRSHLEKTVATLQTRLAQSAEEHKKVYNKIMKVQDWTSGEQVLWLDSSLHFPKIFSINIPVPK